jgi:hypothetical protein
VRREQREQRGVHVRRQLRVVHLEGQLGRAAVGHQVADALVHGDACEGSPPGMVVTMAW